MFSYLVRCAFDRHEAMEAFLAWLRDRHVADVCAAGAKDAEIVVLDPNPPLVEHEHVHVIEIRYLFASREAFDRYEREEAPRLRADGLTELARLGIETTQVVFTRTTGELIPWSR